MPPRVPSVNVPHSYARDLGNRLRQARERCGMSLSDVERKTRGEFMANVVGCYERATRQISVLRLAGLATVYGCDPTSLMPPMPQSGQQPNGSTVRVVRADENLGGFNGLFRQPKAS